MSELVVFEAQRLALAFADYLRLQGIACRVEARELPPGPHPAGSQGYALVLDDDSRQDEAQSELRAFVSEPHNPKYWRASWETGQMPAQALAPSGPGLLSLVKLRLGRAGPVTLGVMLACVLVFLAQLYDPEGTFAWLKFPEGLTPAAMAGQWWRLLTPALMHFSVLHILFNLLWWGMLAALVERTQSSLQLLAVTLLIALLSNVAQFESYGSGFGGLSAVVYGLLGYMWLYPRANPAVGFQLRPGLVWLMVGYMVLGYSHVLDVFAGGPISNNGHAMGFAVGCVLGLLFGLLNRGKPARAQP